MEHIAAAHAGDHVRRKSRRDPPVLFEYQPELTTCELIGELLRLLDIERGAERLVCRYLADLADRVQWRQERMLDAYHDELHAARCCFGLGPREARERVRIGRALRQLPEIERALVDGELSYSRVREITRVATADTEAEWLELARQLGMRTLERRVVRARLGEEGARGAEAAHGAEAARGVEPTAAKKRRVTFDLSDEAWALLERALESARRASGEDCSDGEALEVVARAALTVQGMEVGLPEAVSARGAPVAGTAAGTAAATTVSATTSTTGRAAKPVRPWSWDDLGWGATQSGSSNARNRPSASGGSSQADRRAGRWPHDDTDSNDGDSNDGDSNDGDSNDADSPHSDAHRSNYDSMSEPDAEQAWWAEMKRDVSGRDSKREPERDEWGAINSRLLQAMGGRGRWSADSLIEASGLSAREVNVALTYLQLGGRILRRNDVFEPI